MGKLGEVDFVLFLKVDGIEKKLAEVKVSGTRCKKCNSIYLPPRMDCLDEDMEFIDCENRNTLLAYTTIHTAPAGFEDDAPYTICLVDVDGGGGCWDGSRATRKMMVSIGIREVPEKRMMYSVKPE